MKRAGERSPVTRRHVPVRRGLLLAAFLAAVVCGGVSLVTSPTRATREAVERFRSRPMSLDVRDRTGDRIALLPAPDGIRREYRSLGDTPPLLLEIMIAAEDRRFRRHRGIDLPAMGRAFWTNLRTGRRVSGASTIPMQLARMILPHEGGPAGKRAEILTALRLERLLAKDDILELWLNGLPFSMATEGVSAGARAVFGSSVEQLSPAQMVLLAVIPRSPARLHPGRNPERALAAAERLIESTDFAVSSADLANAVDSAVRIAGGERPDRVVNRAPHAVAAARAEYLQTHGRARVSHLPLVLTIDLGMQRQLEAALSASVARSGDRRIAHAAALAMDHTTGAILAWVGSTSPSGTAPGDQIDGIRTRNPSGSTLKPFLYALAIDRGISVDAPLPNHRAQFGSIETGAYLPVNFSRRFSESVPFSIALASSLNVPTVFLTETLGVNAVADAFGAIGFPDAARRAESLGHGIAVGNTEVSPWELARAFSLFARGGTVVEPTLLSGRTPVVRATPISAEAARSVARILADHHARVPGFGLSNPLATPFPAIFKTGTANQFSDIWAVGSSARLTIVVWMGNHGGATVSGETGSSLPARIAAEFLARHTGVDEAAPWEPRPEQPSAAASTSLMRTRRASGRPAHIRFPADGASFLADPSLPAADRGVPIIAVGSPTDHLTLQVSGREVESGLERVRALLDLPRGTHSVDLLVNGDHTERITIHIW